MKQHNGPFQDSRAFRFISALDRIHQCGFDSNRAMMAHTMVIMLNYVQELAEQGISFEKMSFDELIDSVEVMPAPPSGIVRDMPLAAQVERAILRSQGRLK